MKLVKTLYTNSMKRAFEIYAPINQVGIINAWWVIRLTPNGKKIYSTNAVTFSHNCTPMTALSASEAEVPIGTSL